MRLGRKCDTWPHNASSRDCIMRRCAMLANLNFRSGQNVTRARVGITRRYRARARWLSITPTLLFLFHGRLCNTYRVVSMILITRKNRSTDQGPPRVRAKSHTLSRYSWQLRHIKLFCKCTKVSKEAEFISY